MCSYCYVSEYLSLFDACHLLWSSCRASCVLLSDDTIWISIVGGVLYIWQMRKMQQLFYFFFIQVSLIQRISFLIQIGLHLCDPVGGFFVCFLIYHLLTRIRNTKEPFMNASHAGVITVLVHWNRHHLQNPCQHKMQSNCDCSTF